MNAIATFLVMAFLMSPTISIAAGLGNVEDPPKGGGGELGGAGGDLGTASTTTFTPRVTSGSGNQMTLENCDCDSNARDAAFNNVFFQARQVQTPGAPSNTFDDIVVFGTRADLRSAAE